MDIFDFFAFLKGLYAKSNVTLGLGFLGSLGGLYVSSMLGDKYPSLARVLHMPEHWLIRIFEVLILMVLTVTSVPFVMQIVTPSDAFMKNGFAIIFIGSPDIIKKHFAFYLKGWFSRNSDSDNSN